MSLISINPFSGEILKKIDEWNIQEIKKKIKICYNSQKKWQNISINQKKDYLKNIANILDKNKKKYSKIITLEMGKPILQSKFEIEKCIKLCDYYSENSEIFLKDEIVKTDAKKSYVKYSPLGIILGIMPWNFPFWQVFRWAIPSLIAGNICILKHSSNVPQCGMIIEDIFQESGIGENIFCNIPIKSKNINYLIKNNSISAISLTGSSFAGAKMAEIAGSALKKNILELGGSDPFIVLPDADLKKTVDMAIKSRMQNNGQSCIAAKRFVVHENIFEDFKDSFINKTEKLIIGDPIDEKTDIGPLARKDLVDEIDEQVKTSVKLGAKILTGSEKIESKGFFYPPTVLTNIKNKMPVYNQETFGPIAPLIKVKNDKEAIKIANDTIYGLGASIWTNDYDKARKILNKIRAGSIFINEIVKSDPRLPFGGIKKSGYGRELSHYGIKEFVNIQTIYIK